MSVENIQYMSVENMCMCLCALNVCALCISYRSSANGLLLYCSVSSSWLNVCYVDIAFGHSKHPVCVHVLCVHVHL